MNNIKILITGIEAIDKSIIAKRLVEIDDSLTIIPHFTSNVDMKDNISEFEYFLDTHTIHLAYKNNSIMTVYTNNYTSNGITIDDFYNNDICDMTIFPTKCFSYQDARRLLDAINNAPFKSIVKFKYKTLITSRDVLNLLNEEFKANTESNIPFPS